MQRMARQVDRPRAEGQVARFVLGFKDQWMTRIHQIADPNKRRITTLVVAPSSTH